MRTILTANKLALYLPVSLHNFVIRELVHRRLCFGCHRLKLLEAMALGALLGAGLNILQDVIWKRHGRPIETPEDRLRFACYECALFPLGLIWWAWTCNSDVHWIVPSLAVGCSTVGIYTIFLAVNNYTADTYHRFASSALAAQSLSA